MKKSIGFLCIVSAIKIVGFSYNKERFYVDFNQSMQTDSADFRARIKINRYKASISYLEKLYNGNNLLKKSPSTKTKVPKILHQVWVGGKPLPKKYHSLIKSWKKFHPKWKHVLWTDQKAAKFPMINRKFYEATTDPIEKANILRYEVLYKFGGVYADVDFHCLQPFDILNHTYDFYTGICPPDCRAILNNALIGCTPKHPIMEYCIKTIERDFHRGSRFERTGVMHFTRSFMNVARKAKGTKIALPPSFFYPVPKFYDPKSHYLRNYVKPESFAVHYWASQHNGVHRTIKTKAKKKSSKQKAVPVIAPQTP